MRACAVIPAITGLFTASTVALVSTCSVARAQTVDTATCENMVGTWHNQLGSTLKIASIDAVTGRVEGSYMSPSGTEGQKFPLSGWINSQAPQAGRHNAKVISFSVQWGAYGSITAWTGYCETINNSATITTLWHLVRSNTAYRWDHILTNSDVFVPGAPQ
jgi:hypothetical protein